MPFRLFDCYRMKFMSVSETKSEAQKRLTSLTRGRRDSATNWLRCCVQPVEVDALGLLTERAKRFTASRHEELTRGKEGERG